VLNFKSTLRTAPDLCKNVSFAVLFGSNGNSYKISLHSDMCIFLRVPHNIETLVGQNKFEKIRTAVNAECQGNLSACNFGHVSRRFANPAVGCESVRIGRIQICVPVEDAYAGGFQ
jgi:hypothetical protein